MSKKLLNRVRMSVANAPGTGVVVVNTAAVGFQALSVDLADGDTTSYVIEDGSPLGSVWEYGLGTWSTSGTFTRTTILRSSVGGTTPINASADAILSATILAEDFAPTLTLEQLSDVVITSPSVGDLLRWNGADWVNGASAGNTAPSVVQHASVDVSTTGAISATLGAAPTAGNLLVMIGFGGDFLSGTAEGVYDRQQSWLLSTQYTIGYSMRTVRSGDGATINVGEGDPGGTIPLAAVLLEISGADPTRVSEFLMSQGNAGVSGTHSLNVLAKPNSLIIGVVGGDSGSMATPTPTVSLTTPATLYAGWTNATYNFGGMTFTWGGGSATNALIMALPGV